MQKKPQEHRNNSKIRGRELSGTGASSRRAGNEQQNGGRRGGGGWLVGFRGWSGKISEGKSGHEPTTESGGRLLASIEVTTRYFETSFASHAGCDERVRDD